MTARQLISALLLSAAAVAVTGCSPRVASANKAVSIDRRPSCVPPNTDCCRTIGILIWYRDPATKAERIIYETESDQSTEDGKPVLIRESSGEGALPRLTPDSPVIAVTRNRQLRVTRSMKGAPGGAWTVDTVLENLTGQPMELLFNSICECGPGCPDPCGPDCNIATINGKTFTTPNGKRLIAFGEKENRQIVEPGRPSRPSSYKTTPP